MGEIFEVNIDELKPGQLYLNEDKVISVSRWFDRDTFFDFIEVIEIDNHYSVIDGHTRLFHAYIQNLKSIPVKVYKPKNNELELSLYKECATWCQKSDIRHIKDLENRIVSSEIFYEKWIQHCVKWMEENK